MQPPPSTVTAATTAYPIYKGKVTTRPWSELPPEIIRLIATHYLLEVAASNYCPSTWDIRELWPSRMMFLVYRDALELEKLMKVCPDWLKALETHLFWHQACAIIDPLDVLAQHSVVRSNTTSSAPLRLTPYRHFRGILNCSCHVCRINQPCSNTGLTTAKRGAFVPLLGSIWTCREHRKSQYCGLCLRESPPHGEMINTDLAVVACNENEDTESWPNVATTCRSCRSEWLWRRMNTSPADREAVGGGPPHWAALDWETRQTIDVFVEAGEGTVADVISTARDKWWLRKFTRLGPYMEQAVAASRLSGYDEDGMRTSGDDSRSLEDSSSVDVDAEDYDTLAMTEDTHGVRELAVADWARTRILDGCWVSPADDWYGNKVPGPIVAGHPAPWSLDEQDRHSSHPSHATTSVPAAPTFTLADYLFRTFQRHMRMILMPAMKHIVERIKARAPHDPISLVSRMSMEDVLHQLQQPWPWYKSPPREHLSISVTEPPTRDREDDSSSSSKSDGSHTTSPVLSTSTLQTTPSPPPSESKKDADAESPIEENAGVFSTSEPIPPDATNLIHPIPYVPSTMVGYPSFSQDAFRMAWRDACAPLYVCNCSLCQRATIIASVTAAAHAAARNPGVVPSQPAEPPKQSIASIDVLPTPAIPTAAETLQDSGALRVSQILLSETPYQEEEEEEEEDEEEEEEDYSEIDDTEIVKYSMTVTPRKRSSRELQSEDDDDAVTEDLNPLDPDGSILDLLDTDSALATPPKRARTTGTFSPLTAEDVKAARLTKRPSEEILDDDGDDDGGRKRARRTLSEGGDAEGEDDSLSPPASSDVTAGTAPESSETEGFEFDVALRKRDPARSLSLGLVAAGGEV